MVDITITAANVVPGTGAITASGIAGEAITAGKAVTLDPTTGRYLLCDNDHATVALRKPAGIALTGSNVLGPIVIQIAGELNLGATLTPGVPLFASATAGGICPLADLTTGRTVQMLGLSKTAAIFSMDVNPLNITI